MTLSVEDKYTIRLLVQFKREEIADLTFCYRVVFGLCIDSEDFLRDNTTRRNLFVERLVMCGTLFAVYC